MSKIQPDHSPQRAGRPRRRLGRRSSPTRSSARSRPTVKAMCLYALEVADGRLPGPYSDAQALAYAHAAAAKRN